MSIKYFDLNVQYKNIESEIKSVMQNVISESAFCGGRFVQQFENNFSEYCSGTSALWMALKAVGVQEGDEVITVPNTFIATAEAISICGAKPVFVDVRNDTSTIDVTRIEERITEKTKAIVPVHLYGQMAEMTPILGIAKKYGLKVVEDAAQAHGAAQDGIMAGGYGDAACFSFYPGKNLGAFGEAGAVVTDNSEIFEKVCRIRDHGQESKYEHVCKGSNERMDGLQGAILDLKLKYLDVWNERRRDIAGIYRNILGKNEKITVPCEIDNNKHVYHVYQISIECRDLLIEKMLENDIGYGIHYPVPIHLQHAYADIGCGAGDFPVSEELSKKTLSLPIYPEMPLTEVEFVANFICKRV